MSQDKQIAKSAPTIRDHLSGEHFKNEIAKILPDHMTPERMVRVAITALTRTPKLAQCSQASFFEAMMSLSQWGLEPDGRRAHLIPYGTTCQLIIDYKGLVELAYRSGVVSSIHADVVHEGDLFEYSKGIVADHVPWYLRRDEDKPESEGDVIAVYCEVRMKDREPKCEVMSKDAVEAIRNRSKSGNNGPWKTDWSEMAKKTVFRRVSKWLPLSAEIRDAFEKDDEDVVFEGHVRSTGIQRRKLGDMGSGLDLSTEMQEESPLIAESADGKSEAFASYERRLLSASSHDALIEIGGEFDGDEDLSPAESKQLGALLNELAKKD